MAFFLVAVSSLYYISYSSGTVIIGLSSASQTVSHFMLMSVLLLFDAHLKLTC